MPNRDSRKPQYLAWISIGAASCCIFAGVMVGVAAEFRYETESQKRVSSFAKLKNERIRTVCANSSQAKYLRCKDDEIVEAKLSLLEATRNELDLVAQRSSALWAKIVGLSALLGMAMSAGGIWLVWTTFRETRRAANEAQRSADAFIDAERAWLGISAKAVLSYDRTKMTVHIYAFNSGRTEAIVREIVWFLSNDDDIGGKELLTFPQNSRAIKPSESGDGERFSKTDVDLSSDFLGGYVVYDTRFSINRRAYFLSRVAPMSVDGDGRQKYGLQPRSGREWQINT